MKLKKCVNGHFYDEEKFESCPHCAGGSKLDVNEIFGGAPSAPKPAMAKVEQDDDMTVPLKAAPAASIKPAPAASIRPAVFHTPEEGDEHTAAFYDEEFTAPPLPKVQNLPTPCVGWLIALNGLHAGQDFHLRAGKNYIGQEESMDVALTGEKSVSRNKHAIVIYEPKHHRYFIQPGESNELVYINDEVVLLPMELKPYDLIVIGDIELWFMPLCDAEHNWSEIIHKLQEQMQ